jgi:hypothetical protein
MATFRMTEEYRVREPVETPVLAEIKAIAEEGSVNLFREFYRHPRVSTKTTAPMYVARFRLGGRQISEIESSLSELETTLRRDYLPDTVPA